MNEIRIEGGNPLTGEVRIQGSKNAALPMMAAALLHKGKSVLHRCPMIADVFVMEEILRELGVQIQHEGDTLTLDPSHVRKTEIDCCEGQKMRSSVILLGSLLGRYHSASVPHPGGCVIGERPIDLDLYALERLGAVFEEKEGVLTARTEGLVGNTIHFPKVSVGATQNAVLASVLASGITRLEGCAREPEVVWLCRFLNACGARIEGTGSSVLTITGVEELHGTEFTVPADRIVAGTYVCACAATRGELVLEDAPVEEMEALMRVYEKMGGQYEVIGGKLSLCSKWVQVPLKRQCTEVYPGFPTDLQSPLMAVLCTIPGESCLVETIFEDRFKTASQLQHMGADVRVDGRKAVIRGGTLHGAAVEAQELRGGAALVIAGLAARGETLVRNRQYIERGYEDICRDLSQLGAVIERD